MLKRKTRRQVVRINGKDIDACYGLAHKYKPTSLKLISEVGADATILDVGGGDRTLLLPNFVNLDRTKSSSLVTVTGDAHYLPFRDCVFELIICEAVIEHLRKPWIAVEEFYRVLRFGGFIYADVAFMQPVHAYPNHFFNMTLEGVKVLFERFEEIDSGVQEYQMPSYTLLFVLSRYIRCFLPMVDISVGDIEVYDTGAYISESSTRPKFSSFLLFKLYNVSGKFLRNFDRFFRPEKAQEIAAGVYFTGIKR